MTKRTGVQVTEVVYLLLIWRWLNVSSVRMFAQKSLGLFSQAKKDVMYDLLKREDINWRSLNLNVAAKVYDKHGLGTGELRAFVLDDSIKSCRGKRMEGVSSHFDHAGNTHVMGQQVLAPGLSSEEASLPLDSQLSISKVKTQSVIRPFKDERSAGAMRHDEAIGKSKIQIATGMTFRLSCMLPMRPFVRRFSPFSRS